MKKSKSLLSLLIIGSILISCNNSEDNQVTVFDCLPANLQNGVVAFYPFNSGSLIDASGNNNNLSNPSSAVSGTDRAGNISCAYSFSATSNQYLESISASFLDDLSTSGFSISFWYMSLEELSDYAILISRGDDDDDCAHTVGEWSLSFVNQQMIWGANGNVTFGEYGLPANVWHHIVITSEQSTMNIYTDGTLTSSSSEIYCTSPPMQDVGKLLIGKELDGLTDDVIVYNRIITASEVAELYTIQPCCQ